MENKLNIGKSALIHQTAKISPNYYIHSYVYSQVLICYVIVAVVTSVPNGLCVPNDSGMLLIMFLIV